MVTGLETKILDLLEQRGPLDGATIAELLDLPLYEYIEPALGNLMRLGKVKLELGCWVLN